MSFHTKSGSYLEDYTPLRQGPLLPEPLQVHVSREVPQDHYLGDRSCEQPQQAKVNELGHKILVKTAASKNLFDEDLVKMDLLKNIYLCAGYFCNETFVII